MYRNYLNQHCNKTMRHRITLNSYQNSIRIDYKTIKNYMKKTRKTGKRNIRTNFLLRI